MRAVQITEFGGPEVLTLVDLPEPDPGPGSGAGAGGPVRRELRRHPPRRELLPGRARRCRSSPAARSSGVRRKGAGSWLIVGDGGYAERAVAA